MPSKPPLPASGITPHPARLRPSAPAYAEILRRHREAMEARRSGYIDPVTGLFVLTAAYLWERGSCCDSGCRHCPWVERPPTHEY